MSASGTFWALLAKGHGHPALAMAGLGASLTLLGISLANVALFGIEVNLTPAFGEWLGLDWSIEHPSQVKEVASGLQQFSWFADYAALRGLESQLAAEEIILNGALAISWLKLPLLLLVGVRGLATAAHGFQNGKKVVGTLGVLSVLGTGLSLYLTSGVISRFQGMSLEWFHIHFGAFEPPPPPPLPPRPETMTAILDPRFGAVGPVRNLNDVYNSIPYGSGQAYDITHGYGMRRGDMHTGWDFSGDPTVGGSAGIDGDPIFAPFRGTVVEVDNMAGGYGRQLVVESEAPYQAYVGGQWQQVRLRFSFSHLDRFADGLSPGSQVEPSRLLGFIGDTGHSDGAHLHLEIYAEVTDPQTGQTRWVRIPPDHVPAFIKSLNGVADWRPGATPGPMPGAGGSPAAVAMAQP